MYRCFKIICLFCFVVVFGNVYAEDRGFYAGGSVGYSSIDTLDESDINSILAAGGITATSSVDDNDIGWKIFGGYNLNQYFGVELSYVELGTAEADITVTAPAAGTANIDAEGDGFAFAAVGRYPLHEKFDIFGKVGGFVWDVEATGSITSGATTVLLNAEDDGTDIMYGVGAEYEVWDHIGIRAEWERFELDSDDVDLFTVGIEYDF